MPLLEHTWRLFKHSSFDLHYHLAGRLGIGISRESASFECQPPLRLRPPDPRMDLYSSAADAAARNADCCSAVGTLDGTAAEYSALHCAAGRTAALCRRTAA